MRTTKLRLRLPQLVYLCLTLALLALAPAAGAENPRTFLADYTQIYYNLNNGLLSNEVNCVLQTADGFLWVGSYAGLQRYDGQEFQPMHDDSGKLIKRVRTLFEDSRHRLWIGTNSGLYLAENGVITKDRLEANTYLRAFAESSHGTIYMGTADGLKLRRPNGDNATVEDARLQNRAVISLTATGEDQVWGVTYHGDVFRVNGGKLDAYYPAASFNGLTCISIFCSKSGNLYAGTTGNTLLRYVDGNLVPISTGADTNITRISQDSENRIWLCTDRGLGYLDTARAYHAAAGALMAISLENMVEDYEHNYWVASSRHGLLHLVKSQFHNIGFAGQLQTDVYNATQLYDGNLYIGGENGLVILDRNYQQVDNDLTRLLNGTRIRYLLAAEDGALWLATYKNFGLLRYQDGSWHNWSTAQGLPTEKVRTLLQRRNGDIVAGTGNGIVIMRDGAVARVLGAQDGITTGVILCLAEDSSGNLYCGSDGGGIFKIDQHGTISNINYTQEVDKLGTILSLCWDEDNKGLWISNGGALQFLSQDGVHSIESGDLDFNNILDIKLVGDYIWLLQDRGVHIMRSKALAVSAINDYHYLKYNDTLHSTLTANAKNQLTPEGRLYLSTSMGVLRLDTKTFDTGEAPLKLAIADITVNSLSQGTKDYPAGKEVTLPADANRVTIRFAALTYGGKAPELEYQLQGVDEAPIVVHGKNVYEATYTNLPGGSYKFRVQAKNSPTTNAKATANCSLKKAYTPLELPWIKALLLMLFAGVVAYLASKFRLKMEEKRRLAAEQKAAAEITRRKEYQNLTNQAIHAIAKTIDAKDKYTNGHSVRVAQYAREIAKEEHWSEDQQEKLFYTALLHDIGKIGIPDKILNKPGKLSQEEYAIIKQHTTIGYHILQDMTSVPYVQDGAHYHHEHYDGSGYPEGLKGDAIPEVARLIGVADSVDAMYSARIYRPEMTIDYIKDELVRCSGTQFDPRFAADMLHVLERGFKASDTLKLPEVGAAQGEKVIFEK
ncbi:MAG: HD domain-containing protein [Acidaminococcaceae bacterium]|nr:HD domain-containing protein [Acidaminococcaceae bacterium]